MMINVPQFIDIEDKIVGPLTAKQLGWMIFLGIVLLILWKMAPLPVFIVIGLPLALLVGGLAFYRPYGQPLGGFIIFGIMYFFRPKIYFWKRPIQSGGANIPQKAPNSKENQFLNKEKSISKESLAGLAGLLDSEGTQYNETLQEILRNAPVKK